MSYYILKVRGAVEAISKDEWLLQLFAAQREVNPDWIKLEKKKGKVADVKFYDKYLKYYFGYAITRTEYEYVTRIAMEDESDLHMQIYDLETILSKHKKSLSKKQVKNIKKTISILKKIDTWEDKKYIRNRIDDILHRPVLVREYMENLEMFRHCMEDY